MCTSITLESFDNYHFIGRTMDIEYDFQQSTLCIPRDYLWTNRYDKSFHHNRYAIIAMGCVVENHPLLADGMNEVGLAITALNFPTYCVYEQPNSNSISAYDVVLQLVGSCKTTQEAKQQLESCAIIDYPFNKELPLPSLHWMIYDKSGTCLVVEITKNGKKIYDNPVGVLSNAPTFDYHLMSLHRYSGLSNKNPASTLWGNYKMQGDGVGLGMMGIPGDFYSNSRFVRASCLREFSNTNKNKEKTLSNLFHILDNVAMISGVACCNNLHHTAIYTCVMSLDTGTYYYKTYDNSSWNATSFDRMNLNKKDITVFTYFNTPTIHYYK